jgi:anti-sigma regulatory factor (Ser/Thr protein kinase)
MMMEIYYDFGTSLITLLRSCDEKKLVKIKLKVTELLATYESHAEQGEELGRTRVSLILDFDFDVQRLTLDTGPAAPTIVLSVS